MKAPPKHLFKGLLILVLLYSCSDKSPDVPTFRLIGSIKIDPKTTFMNTTFGGISGIDMDGNGTFYLISDDDGQYNPPRFYTATLDYDQSTLRSLNLQNVVFIKTPAAGSSFQSFDDYVSHLGGEYSDGESIRYNTSTSSFFWTSEGTFIPNAIPAQPFIRQITSSGNHLSEIATPPNFRYRPTEPNKGLIINATFEAMCLIPGTDELWVALEAPLIEDGPRTTHYTSGSAVRLARINWKTGAQLGQYAYVPEKNPLVPVPANSSSNNGVTEVLSINEHRLLVLERSFSTGYPISKGNNVVVFEVNFDGATDISQIPSLLSGNYSAVTKKEVLNFSKVFNAPDNVESMCWGPDLANGNRSLVMIVDDNFSTTQQFQVFVFEVSAKFLAQ